MSIAWNLEVQANYALHIIVIIDQVSKSPSYSDTSYSWVISTCGLHGSVLLVRKRTARTSDELRIIVFVSLKRVVGHYYYYYYYFCSHYCSYYHYHILILISIVAVGF